METFYPQIIKNLPQADIPFKGLTGWLMQSADHQLVFFKIEPIGKVPEHSHGAQWGVVLEGEIELTINGVRNTYKKGDSYYIPAGVIHSATFNKKSYIIDYFEDRNRYKTK